jgi:hypothetical protein
MKSTKFSRNRSTQAKSVGGNMLVTMEQVQQFFELLGLLVRLLFSITLEPRVE